MEKHVSHSPEETASLGRAFGASLSEPTVVCFFGDLAAGKTTFIKGVAAGAGGIEPEAVQSPTFSYLNIYEGTTTVYHFDLYRLHNIEEFISMGFDEYLEAGGICCIEWSERISAYLPPNCIQIRLEHGGEDQRIITVVRES